MTTAIWILAADCGRARVFEAGPADNQLYHLKEFVNKHGRGLPGRQCDVVQAKAPDAPAPAEGARHPALQFAHELAGYLEKARGEQRYDGLYLVAPKRFLRVLRATLPEPVRALVAEEIDRRPGPSVDDLETDIRGKLNLSSR